MTLLDAVYALDELARGRIPDADRVRLGVLALDPLVTHAESELDLLEAAATLELFLAQGMTPYGSPARRTRAGHLAAAVRRAVDRSKVDGPAHPQVSTDT